MNSSPAVDFKNNKRWVEYGMTAASASAKTPTSIFKWCNRFYWLRKTRALVFLQTPLFWDFVRLLYPSQCIISLPVEYAHTTGAVLRVDACMCRWGRCKDASGARSRG